MEKKFIRLILGLFLFFTLIGNGWSQEVNVADERLNHAIMRPDPATLDQWVAEYEAAQPAYIDEEISLMLMQSEALNLESSMTLLSHLQYTPSERNQGGCGDCWVWASTGAMEIALDVQNGIHDRLSVQFVNSCKTDSYPCCGGSPSGFAEWYTSKGYAIPWSNTNASFQDGDHCCPTDQGCTKGSPAVACANISTSPKYNISSIAPNLVPTQNVEQATAIANVKNLLNQNKAVVFRFFMGTSADWSGWGNFWNNQSETDVWDPDSSCGKTWVNGEGGGHDVLIVGYDDGAATPYWLVLNSWGAPSNRPNGLFRLKMNLNYNCIVQRPTDNLLARQFVTQNVQFNAAPPPGKATLIEPVGTWNTNSPTYKWNPVSGATWYQLWVNDSATNGKIQKWYTAADANCSSGTCSVTPGITLASGTAKWWIQTYNANGYGPWSDPLTFTVPAPVMPGKVTLIEPSGAWTTNLPTYKWNPDAQATWYRLWVKDVTGCRIDQWYSATAAGCAGGAGTCAVTPGTALFAGAAKWWVETYSPNGYGPWSDGMDFTVPAPVLPGKATLIEPNGAIETNTPTYKWNPVSSATWYRLWVKDNRGCRVDLWYSAAAANCSTGTCSATPASTVLGASVWYIQTYNANGYGPWSDGMSFTAPTPVTPGKATLLEPTGTIYNKTPTYKWNAVANSNWYYLWVNDSAGTRILQWYSATQASCPDGTGFCSVTPGTVLNLGSAMWWIQTHNSGVNGPWSDGMSFTVRAGQCTSPPPAATLVSPSGTVQFVTPDFRWNAVSTASQYLLWVNDSATNGKIQKWYTAADAGCASGTGVCTINPGLALNPGNGTWYIQTKNDCGYGPWSSGMSFNIQVAQGQTSFVLTWGQTPRDIDSHLLTPSINGTKYHVYYSWKGYDTSPPYAKLDVDDTTSYGPETTTLYQLFTGTYHFYVYNWSQEANLAGCGAQVKIYGPTGNLLNTVIIPGSGTGLYWHVADLDGATGAVTIINQIAASPPSAAGFSNLEAMPRKMKSVGRDGVDLPEPQ
jgi:C1A family cysteine protease